jgi:hypothetical protein
VIGGVSSSFRLNNANGEVYFGEKSKELFGTQDINFTGTIGHIQVRPSLGLNLHQISVSGDVSSLVSKTGNTETILSQKNFIPDYLCSPYPLAISGLTLIFALAVSLTCVRFWVFRLDVIVIFATIFFCLGSLIWAINTGQPLWLQNILSLVPLFITVITYLAEHEKHRT